MGGSVWSPTPITQNPSAVVEIVPSDVGAGNLVKVNSGATGFEGVNPSTYAQASELPKKADYTGGANTTPVINGAGDGWLYKTVSQFLTWLGANNANGPVVLDAAGKYPAKDGSAITNITVPTIYRAQVRHTAEVGVVDSNGLPAFLVTGTGLAVNLVAASSPLVLNFANGKDDFVSILTQDVTNVITGLSANAYNYLYAQYADQNTVTWGKTANPPQCGFTYKKDRQLLLNFAGADASTSIIDAYGNTCSVAGNAQIDTAVQIDGMNTCLMDGTGDYISCTTINQMPPDGDALELKLRFNSLPTAGSNMGIVQAKNSGNYGLYLFLTNSAGVMRLGVYASSTGTSWDVANAVTGSNTSWATGTTYHVAIVRDPITGKYYVYKDGVLDITITSTSKLCWFDYIRFGDSVGLSTPLNFNGCIAGVRLSPFCRYPAGTTFTVPNISTFAVEGHWFSVTEKKMYEITGASSVAGNNPTMTAVNRLFLSEAACDATTITSLINYAYCGMYEGQPQTAAAGAEVIWNHNIGLESDMLDLTFLARAPNLVGLRHWLPSAAFSSAATYALHPFGSVTSDTGKTNITIRTRTSDGGIVLTGNSLSAAPSQYKVLAKRIF